MSLGADEHFPQGDIIVVCVDSVSGGGRHEAEKVEKVVALHHSNDSGSRVGHALDSHATPILLLGYQQSYLPKC